MRINSSLSRRTLISATVGGALISALRDSHAQESVPETSPPPAAPLGDQVLAMLAECDSIFGVLIVDGAGNTVFEHNPDMPFVSASLYKLVLIADTLLKVERGELALDERIEIREDFFIAANGDDSYFNYSAIGYEATLEELLYSAGCYSSNTGAQALVSLTSVEELDALAVQLGLTSTFYRLLPEEVADLYEADPDTPTSTEYARSVRFIQSFATGSDTVNVTTPRDVGRIFELLRDDALGSAVTSWRLKQILSARVINDRLPALLPVDTYVVHKTGNLPGVLHDAGIIDTPGGAVVAVAMAQAATEFDLTMSVEQRIGLLAFSAGLERARQE